MQKLVNIILALSVIVLGVMAFDKPEINTGAVSPVNGACTGSEPATQLCNVNAYDFSSQSGVSAATLNVSGAAALSGATTFSGTTKVQATASSTLIVGGAGVGGGYKAGCLKIGDSASATSTPVYITATGATITATTTRPAICSSQ